MAGVYFQVMQDAIASGTALKTLVQIIAAANVRVRIHKILVTTDGATAAAVPVLIQVAKQTTAGTVTANTPVKRNPLDTETLNTTASHTATVEPTTTDIYVKARVHPQGGRLEINIPADRPLYIPGGARLGVLVTAAATVNVSVSVDCEE